MTIGYWVGLSCAIVGGYVVGYVRGLDKGESHNWLLPTVKRQARQLEAAWDALNRGRR